MYTRTRAHRNSRYRGPSLLSARAPTASGVPFPRSFPRGTSGPYAPSTAGRGWWRSRSPRQYSRTERAHQLSSPASECHAHILHLQVAVQGLQSLLPTEAGTFVPAERELDIETDSEAIDPHLPSLELLGGEHCSRNIRRVDTGHQAELRVVRHRDRLFGSVERDDAHERAEDLLPHDSCVGRKINHHRRTDEEAILEVGVTRELRTFEHRSLAPRDRHILLDALLLRPRNNWTHVGIVHSVAEAHRLVHRAEALNNLVVSAALHEQACSGIADLPRVQVHALVDDREDTVEIGISKDQLRALATEFHVGWDRVERGGLDDPRPDGNGAREGYLVHSGVAGKSVSNDRARAVDDVDDAVGEADVLHDLREVVERNRSLGGRFDYHRAAGSQRRRDTADGDLEGVVPGHDLGAHADRFTDRPVHHAWSEWNRGALELVTNSCIEFEEPGGAVHFPVGIA